MSEESLDCNALFIAEDYDLGLHIGSIFIILAFSFMGALIPILLKKYFSASSLWFQISKLFGAGVIFATAWIHMLTASIENLHHPCLPEAVLRYDALPGVSALFGALFTLLIQVIANEALSKIVKLEKRSSALNVAKMEPKIAV